MKWFTITNDAGEIHRFNFDMIRLVSKTDSGEVKIWLGETLWISVPSPYDEFIKAIEKVR